MVKKVTYGKNVYDSKEINAVLTNSINLLKWENQLNCLKRKFQIYLEKNMNHGKFG